MDRATKIAAARALLLERRQRLDNCNGQAAEAPADEVRRLEADVLRLTHLLLRERWPGLAQNDAARFLSMTTYPPAEHCTGALTRARNSRNRRARGPVH
jgi:hypothetical protein